MQPDKDRAKRVILEILCQTNDGTLGKTKLFKAFWLAHLYYSKMARGYLSDWPIVRMPKGPGIDQAELLITELIDSGDIKKTYEQIGPFTEINCRLIRKPEGELSKIAIESIKKAVDDVTSYTANSLSESSHAFSRSWNTNSNGAELDIYNDLIPDDIYEERRQELVKLNKAYEEMFE